MKNVWYKIVLGNEIPETFLGLTEDPNVYMWFARAFPENRDNFIVTKHYIEKENELVDLVSEEIGGGCTYVDYFILDMTYVEDIGLPIPRDIDEDMIDYIADEYKDRLSDALRTICAAVAFIRFKNFDKSIGRCVKNLILYLYINTRIYDGKHGLEFDISRLMMNYINEEGLMYYGGY